MFYKTKPPKMGILIRTIIICNKEGAEGPQNGPKGRWGPEGPPSPLQELEGRAQTTLNLQSINFLRFNSLIIHKKISSHIEQK